MACYICYKLFDAIANKLGKDQSESDRRTRHESGTSLLYNSQTRQVKGRAHRLKLMSSLDALLKCRVHTSRQEVQMSPEQKSLNSHGTSEHAKICEAASHSTVRHT